MVLPIDGNPDHCGPAGRPVWVLHPERTEVVLDELLLGAPFLIRYLGQVPVSLLDHLALCVELAIPEGAEVAAYAAAHDLHELYIGDWMPAVKRAVPGLRAIEQAWEAHTHRALGLDWPPRPAVAEQVRAIDLGALDAEMALHAHPLAHLVEHHRLAGAREVLQRVIRMRLGERMALVGDALRSCPA